MKKIRTGLAGYGLSGEVFHAPFLHTNPLFEFAMVMERSKNLARKRYPYVERVHSFDQMILDPSIELVVITTPNEYHFEMIKEALMKDKHVLVEKPFTVTSSEGYKLDDLAKKRNLVLAVYHNRRWDGDFLTVQALLKQELAGNPSAFEAHFDRFESGMNFDSWREKDLPGSGVLFDLGSHLIDQALCLFGKPEEVTANIEIQREGGMADDAFDIHLHYKTLTAVLKSGMLIREPGPRYQLHGSKGSFIKYGIDPQEERLKAGAWPDEKDFGFEPEESWGILNTDFNGLHFRGNIETLPGQYNTFYNKLYESIRDGKKVPVSASEAAAVIDVIECARKSAAEGRTIRFIDRGAE
ncbi:Gfo/Idh/MocA family oxidoreductase [Metabacillus sp. 84]|uniref:Gfo/Idh/MocA family oxidoreductase n=1 Tax=Metabacillus sp. 84 TaxID=3404705 RepID=UPI003CF2C21D